MGLPEYGHLVIANLVAAAIVAAILLLPKSWRLTTHVVVFLMLSFGLVSVHHVTEAQGHLLFIFTILVWCHYGIPRGHKVFVLLGLAVLWLTAVAIAGAGYVYQPPPPHTVIRLRRLRAIQYMLVYAGVVWQLWVAVVRPEKRLRDQYDRKVTHLNTIVERYRRLIRDRLIRPDEPGPDRARILDIAMEVMGDARVEGMMTKEELSFLHSVLEDCRREYGRVSKRMNAAISQARILLERGSEPRSTSE